MQINLIFLIFAYMPIILLTKRSSCTVSKHNRIDLTHQPALQSVHAAEAAEGA